MQVALYQINRYVAARYGVTGVRECKANCRRVCARLLRTIKLQVWSVKGIDCSARKREKERRRVKQTAGTSVLSRPRVLLISVIRARLGLRRKPQMLTERALFLFPSDVFLLEEKR